MTSIFQYLLYGAAFLTVVLAIEGLSHLVRGNLGDERVIARRLAKARSKALAQARIRDGSDSGADALARAIGARLPWLDRALTRADAPFNALHILLLSVVLFACVFMLLKVAHAPQLIAFAAAAAVAVGAPSLVLTGLASSRRKRFLDQLPQAVDLIARSLQAGHPVTTAMSVVSQRMPAPLGPEFRMVVEEMTYGLDRDEAMENLLRRFPLAELRMFVACLEVTRESGGNLAEVFLKLAEAIRAKDHLRRKVHAISAEGRMSFWVVSGLPFAVGGAIMLMRPTFYTDVLQDHLFWPMMSYAPVSLSIGAFMIWRMVNLKI
jgi:tight adherence protein B